MKVRAIQFVPITYRPPLDGEWIRVTEGRPFEEDRPFEFRQFDPRKHAAIERTIYSIREVEVEVEDPVPEWIDAAFDRADREITPGSWVAYRIYAKHGMAAAYRAHVAERAKAAAARIMERAGLKYAGEGAERIIREEFLR